MKAYLVYKTFNDGSIEGVVFSNKDDAESAYNGVEDGSYLAVGFISCYGGEDNISMVEIEI